MRAACVALAWLSAACVSAKPPGLRMGKGETDVVFGASKAPTAPAADAAATDGGAPADEDYLPGDFELVDGGNPVPRRRTRPVVPRDECPEAGLNDFPAQAASTTIMGTPAEGRYKWKRHGSITVTTPQGGKQDRQLSGFERRVVSKVTTTQNGYTFEVMQDDPRTGGLVRTVYRVTTGPATTSVGSTGVSTNTESAAIRLVLVEYLDPSSGRPVPEKTFRPTPSLVLVLLPVRSGGRFTTSGVDANAGIVEVDVQVFSRQRIDACGDVVDGWRVTTTWHWSKHDSTRISNYEFVVATQLGGIFIFERRSEDGSMKEETSFSLAQLRPEPVPG